MASFNWPPQPTGGGGGVSSINGDTSSSQFITGSSPLKVANSGATHVLSGPFPSFAFKPGATQTAPGGNVYNLWSVLYADLIKVSGIKNVFVDDTLATATIPAGTYDLTGVVFYGSLSNLINVILNLADGVVLSGMFQEATNSIIIRSLSSTPVFTQSTDQLVVIVSVGASIENNGTAEIFTAPLPDQQVIFFADAVAGLQNNTYELVNLSGSGSQCLIFGGLDCTATSDIVRGVSDASVILFYSAASALLSPIQSNLLSGTVVILFQENASAINYDNVNAAGLAATTVQAAITEIGERRCSVSASLSQSASSVSTTETTILDVTNFTTLTNFNDQLEIIMEGEFAANVNLKTIKLYIAGTQVYSSGALALNGGRFRVTCYFVVVAGLGSGTAYTFATSTNALIGTQAAKTSVTADFSMDQEVSLTGTGVTTGDILGEFGLVRRNFNGF